MDYLRARIRGRVQGVGYRHFIRLEADRLGLTGCVRNLADGDVEIEAEGERPTLDQLLERAGAGPPHARVTHITAQWDVARERFSRFRIES